MRRSRFSPPPPLGPASASVSDLTTFFARLDARLDEIELRLRKLEESRPKHRPRYASPDELAREYGISEQTLRGWLFSRAENGMDEVIVTQGRRLYLDREAFARWFARGEDRPRRQTTGRKNRGRAEGPPQEGA